MPVTTGTRKKTSHKIAKTALYSEMGANSDLLFFSQKEFNMIERLIRVEEEIKSINKNIEILVHQMDKRFEDMQHYMDKRFEQIDKRFTQMFTFMSIVFTVLGVLMTVYKFID